jgi:hypothetical protein
MGYRDQKVIRDTRDAQAAEFIGAAGSAFKQTVAQGQKRQKEKKEELEKEEKETKALQKQAQSAVSGRYQSMADYKKTGNKSLDEQVLAEIEKAAREESDLYMKAFGNDGTPELIADYQKLVATNNRDLNDLTMFIGTFDQDVDQAAFDIANGKTLLPGSGDFAFELDIQKGGAVELKKGKDGRYSLFGVSGGGFPGQELSLGQYHDDIKKGGTRYEMIDDDYGLVMDEWSKSIIENGDNLYKQSQQTGGSTKVSTGKKDGGTGTTTPGVKGNVYNVDGYKNDIIKKLKAGQVPGGISASTKGGPELSNEQIFYQVKDNLPGYTAGMTLTDYSNSVGGIAATDNLFNAFADQVIDLGTYKRGGITNVVATNITDPNAGIKNVTLNQ